MDGLRVNMNQAKLKGRPKDEVWIHFHKDGKISKCKFCSKEFSSPVALALRGHLSNEYFARAFKTTLCDKVDPVIKQRYIDFFKEKIFLKKRNETESNNMQWGQFGNGSNSNRMQFDLNGNHSNPNFYSKQYFDEYYGSSSFIQHMPHMPQNEEYFGYQNEYSVGGGGYSSVGYSTSNAPDMVQQPFQLPYVSELIQQKHQQQQPYPMYQQSQGDLHQHINGHINDMYDRQSRLHSSSSYPPPTPFTPYVPLTAVAKGSASKINTIFGAILEKNSAKFNSFLKSASASMFVNQRNQVGDTPLHCACFHGIDGFVLQLLIKGANVNHMNMYGHTPLHHASEMGRLECIKILFQHNAVVDANLNRGYTPLHLCCLNGHTECASLLIENGAFIEAEDHEGDRPLHLTCYNYGNVSLSVMLLQCGANLLTKNNIGNTPLHIACMRNIVDCALLFMQTGASISDVNYRGKSCLELATDEHVKETVGLYHNTYLDRRQFMTFVSTYLGYGLSSSEYGSLFCQSSATKIFSDHYFVLTILAYL